MKLIPIDYSSWRMSDIQKYVNSEEYTLSNITKRYTNPTFTPECFTKVMQYLHESPKLYVSTLDSDADYIIEYGEIVIYGVKFKIAEVFKYHSYGHRDDERISNGSNGSSVLLYENALLKQHYFISDISLYAALIHTANELAGSKLHCIEVYSSDGRKDVNLALAILNLTDDSNNFHTYYDASRKDTWLKVYHEYLTNRYDFIYPAGTFKDSINFSIPKAMYLDDIINFNYYIPEYATRDVSDFNAMLEVETKYGDFRYDVYMSLSNNFIREAGDPLHALTVKQAPPLQCEINFAVKVPNWIVNIARKYKLNIHF